MKARKRASHKKILSADLAQPEEVRETISLYTHYFERDGVDLPLASGEAPDAWDALVEDLGDMGVDTMKGKTADELSELLGFLKALPVNWNSYRAADNLVLSWDSTSVAAASAPNRLQVVTALGISRNQTSFGKSPDRLLKAGPRSPGPVWAGLLVDPLRFKC